MSKLLYIMVHNPGHFFAAIWKRIGVIIPDKPYLKLLYRLETGQKLDLMNPQSFNEKLQWLKLYDRQPEHTLMVDKYTVKEYVAKKIGPQYIIPTLGVWDKIEDIDWDILPEKFVLKTTHGGGGRGVIICKQKSLADRKAIVSSLRYSLRQNIYRSYREWPYKNVPHRIIAEQFIDPSPDMDDLHDYKFFCFNGKVKCFKIDFNRQIDHHANYYDPNGHLLPFGEVICPPIYDKVIDIPNNLFQMIELAEALSEGIRFVRVDLYSLKSQIYFGEMTFFPAGGVGQFTPREWDRTLGDMINL